MTTPESLRLIAMLASYFTRELSAETAALWARELVEFEVIDGMEAAQVYGVGGRFMPSLAEFISGIKDARHERLRTAAPPLPAGRADSNICAGCGGLDEAGFVHFWMTHASAATKASAERQAADRRSTFARWVPAAKAAEARA